MKIKTAFKEMSKQDAERKKSLGDIGENIAYEVLVDRSFTNVKNLNVKKTNHRFADLFAEKSGKRYVISVKTRNKCQVNGLVNEYYNLLTEESHKKNMREVEKEYNAQAHWMAVQVDAETYSVYFGSVEELGGKKTITINLDKCAKGKQGECFVKNEKHGFDMGYLSNK